MNIERLTLGDVEELFEFELENRAWFESLIAARKDSFYSLDGVREHVERLSFEFENGIGAAYVMKEEREIAARVNLKSICDETKSAEVGYRVAKKHAGKGVATACLGHAIQEASERFGLKTLRAKVLENNLASVRVLEKYGFEPIAFEPRFYWIGGLEYGCTTFERFV